MASVAHANVEIGGLAGLHAFSESNGLGVTENNPNSLRNSALFGVRLGMFFGPMVGVEVEGGALPSETREPPAVDVTNIVVRAQVAAQFRAANANNDIIPFVVGGGGIIRVVDSLMEDVFKKDTKTMFYAGAGAKYRAGNNWGVRVDARVLFVPKLGSGQTPEFELLAGLYKEFGRPVRALKEEKVVDKTPKDDDGDGIVGDADKCPQEAEDKDGFQDDDGCPDADNDSDGIADAADKCPKEAEDKDGFQDDDGCPDADNDGDGFADAADKCPQEAEVVNGIADEDGCADDVPDALKPLLAGPVAKVDFKANTADFAPGATAALDKIAPVLTELKDAKVEVGVHTDDSAPKGKFTDNDALSQARAEAVVAYLVKKGVPEGVLVAKGYAANTPVQDPKDLKGAALTAARTKNRRVELKLVVAAAKQAEPAATEPAPAPTP